MPPDCEIRQFGAVVGHDMYERLPEIKIPTLVINGDSDCIVPIENARILASKIPGAELVIITNAEHLFMFEAEKETAHIIGDFLKRHPYSRNRE